MFLFRNKKLLENKKKIFEQIKFTFCFFFDMEDTKGCINKPEHSDLITKKDQFFSCFFCNIYIIYQIIS